MDLKQSDIDNGLEAIKKACTTKELETQRLAWMGKQGAITQAFKSLGTLSAEEKPKVAKTLNTFKTLITNQLALQKDYVAKLELDKAINTKIDVSIDPSYKISGQHHPIHQVIKKLNQFFSLRGFESKSEYNLEIEDEWHNFEMLNIPSHHPARSMQDTFYCGEKILRTHVSATQPRILKDSKLPLNAVVFGRVYRCDTPDATHTPVFHQMECISINRHCNFGHLKTIIEDFILFLFGEKLPIRYRASYFPFTEPSVEIDVWMPEKNAWLEILGAGMVHPNVIKNAGHDPSSFRGFAFGVGIERLAMLYFDLDDVRDLYGSDLSLLGDCYLWQ